MSNTNIEAALTNDLETVENPQIVIDNVGSSVTSTWDATESANKFEKSHSSDHMDALLKTEEQTSRGSGFSKDLSLNLMSAMHEGDNAFQSLKSGFTSATTALVSPASPLSRLAKGVQNLSTNLDPRRLRNVERSNESMLISENTKVKEKWTASGCKSKLIAL